MAANDVFLNMSFDGRGRYLYLLVAYVAGLAGLGFNMPFELGLCVARKPASWFVFEAKNHRLLRTLSDLNGYDAKVHGGKSETLLAGLRDIFANKERRRRSASFSNCSSEYESSPRRSRPSKAR